MIGNLFCKGKEGFKIKVGSIRYDHDLGKPVFTKHKPHLMRVIGVNGGYGIQKFVTDSVAREWDLQNLFRKSPDMLIVIKDEDTGKTWHSQAQDWIDHQHKGNYGDGSQIFLSVDYMTEIKKPVEAENGEQLSI